MLWISSHIALLIAKPNKIRLTFHQSVVFEAQNRTSTIRYTSRIPAYLDLPSSGCIDQNREASGLDDGARQASNRLAGLRYLIRRSLLRYQTRLDDRLDDCFVSSKQSA